MAKRPQFNLPLFKYIGAKIKEARTANIPARMDGQKNPNAMTQTELAKAAGVSFQQIQKYEKGVNKVPIDILLAIGIKTKREDINWFLPHDISKETLVLTEDMEVK